MPQSYSPVFVPAVTRADVLITAVETGADVVFSYSGSIDLSGLGTPDDSGTSASGGIVPSTGIVTFASVGSAFDQWLDVVDLPAFGGLGDFLANGTGDLFGITGPVNATILRIKDGYISNDPLAGSMTFVGQTFASLGITPGTYTTNLPDDTITLIIGQVPLPATLLLLISGIAGVGAVRTWKRR